MEEAGDPEQTGLSAMFEALASPASSFVNSLFRAENAVGMFYGRQWWTQVSRRVTGRGPGGELGPWDLVGPCLMRSLSFNKEGPVLQLHSVHPTICQHLDQVSSNAYALRTLDFQRSVSNGLTLTKSQQNRACDLCFIFLSLLQPSSFNVQRPPMILGEEVRIGCGVG